MSNRNQFLFVSLPCGLVLTALGVIIYHNPAPDSHLCGAIASAMGVIITIRSVYDWLTWPKFN